MITTLDWLIDVLLPTIFTKLDSWYVIGGVSILGISATMFLIVYIYGRLT